MLNLDTEEDDVGDIIKEINLLSQLKHSDSQNITKYFGSFLHGTKLWIIMEYAAGGSIRSLVIDSKRIPIFLMLTKFYLIFSKLWFLIIIIVIVKCWQFGRKVYIFDN